MGGAAAMPGNVSAVAEANIRNDPEAAHIVFRAGWPLVMVGLDVTTKTVMSDAYMEELRGANNRYTDFIYAISRHYNNFYKQIGITGGFHVHDSSALAYLIDPTLFTTRPAFVDVEYHSPITMGRRWPTGAAGASRQIPRSASTWRASGSSKCTASD